MLRVTEARRMRSYAEEGAFEVVLYHAGEDWRVGDVSVSSASSASSTAFS